MGKMLGFQGSGSRCVSYVIFRDLAKLDDDTPINSVSIRPSIKLLNLCEY